jgi:ABC-2 type transport system permease protein
MKHEFRQTIKRKSFIIMTLIFPVLSLLGILSYQITQELGEPVSATQEEQEVGYVDETRTFTGYTNQPNITLVSYPNEQEAKNALLNEDIKEYLIIPNDYLSSGTITRYTTKRELETPGEVQQGLKNFLLSNLLTEKANFEIIERVKSPMHIVTLRLDEAGEIAEDQGGFGAFVVPYLFAILLCMSIFTSSGFLLQSVAEEKENRIMEILLSSISALQLLIGKVLGLGAAGLLQIVIWLASAMLLAGFASTSIGGMLSTLTVPSSLLNLAVVYFILGYLLFAILMATVGSIGTTAREGQQISGIFTMMGVIPLMLAGFIIPNPDHTLATALTLFPLTSPVTVMMRLGLTTVPIWEMEASIALLAISIVVAMLLGAKVFRAGLLMYGKRASFGEIIKIMKAA